MSSPSSCSSVSLFDNAGDAEWFLNATESGYAVDGRARVAYHDDGDDAHSAESNRRLAAFNAAATARTTPAKASPKTAATNDHRRPPLVPPRPSSPAASSIASSSLSPSRSLSSLPPPPPRAERAPIVHQRSVVLRGGVDGCDGGGGDGGDVVMHDALPNSGDGNCDDGPRPEDIIIERIRHAHNHVDNAIARREFAEQVMHDVETFASQGLQWLLTLDICDEASVMAMHHKLVYMHVSFNLMLAWDGVGASAGGGGGNASVSVRLCSACGALAQMEYMLHTAHALAKRFGCKRPRSKRLGDNDGDGDDDNDGDNGNGRGSNDSRPSYTSVPLTLNYDAYRYDALAQQPHKVECHTIEALVFKALETGQYAVMLETGDGRGGDDHRLIAGDISICVLKRAYYHDGFKHYHTHYYGRLYDFRKFVHHTLEGCMVGRTIGSAAVESFLKRMSNAPDNLLHFAPRLVYHRDLMCFANGVYVLSEDRFYGNDDALPRDQRGMQDFVPRIFHALDFVHDEYAAVRVSDDDFYDDEHTPALFDGIATPALDRLLAPQRFPNSATMVLYALLGRMLHSLGSVGERKHVLPMLIGVGGSGKSTLCSLMARILRSCTTSTIGTQAVVDTEHAARLDLPGQRRLAKPRRLQTSVIGGGGNCGEEAAVLPVLRCKHVPRYENNHYEIESRVEESFPLQNALGRLAWICSEWTKDTNFPRAFLLKMATGERIEVSIKNRAPVSVQWDQAGMLAGNDVPRFSDTQGQFERRVACVRFLNKPDKSEEFEDVLEAELPAIILKINRAYLAWARFAANKDLYALPSHRGALPAYFEDTRDFVMASISKAGAFWYHYRTQQLLEYEIDNDELTTDLATLLKHFRAFVIASATTTSKPDHPPVTTTNMILELIAFLGRRWIKRRDNTLIGMRLCHDEPPVEFQLLSLPSTDVAPIANATRRSARGVAAGSSSSSSSRRPQRK